MRRIAGMARGALKTSRRWIHSLVLGIAATLAVAAAHLTGLDRPVELQVLDLRFRWWASAPEPESILHVDIDDRSLDELGRWPWPREKLAGIIETLHTCGARTIFLDAVMPEPQKVRYVAVQREVYGRYDEDVTHDVPPVPVFDDAILASAIAGSGRFFLAAHLDYADRDEADALQEWIRGMLRRLPSASFEAVRTAASTRPAAVEATVPVDVLAKAYIKARSAKAMERFSIAPGSAEGYPLRAATLIPPLVTFVEASHGSGFVSFEFGKRQVMRRIHLLARGGERIYPQIALAMAADELGRRHGGAARITADRSAITIRCTDAEQRVIPLDESGAMLINWNRSTWGTNQRRHISAAGVDFVRQAIQDMERRGDLAHVLRVKLIEMGRAVPAGLDEQFWQAVRNIKALDKAYRARVDRQRHVCREALYRPGRQGAVAELARLRRQEQKAQEKAWPLAEQIVAEIRKPPNLEVFLDKPGAAPADVKKLPDYEQAVERFKRDKAAAEKILRQLDQMPAATERLKRSVAERKKELADLVAGRICMIGSTATGAPDFVPTPLWTQTPGVVVNANILNTILSGDFVAESHVVTNVLVILAAGLAVSLLAATRPVFEAGPIAVLLGIVYATFNAFVVFALWRVWVVAAAPLVAMLVSFILITAHRQFTEERAKRHIKGLFAHAMSPALVDRLLEDPSLAELGGQKRNLSCMFSDLGGFTSLSESLGPQETVRLLNRYFDRAAEVIQDRCGGYLNKFLGDGIFAFFGAPVFQSDHARRAVEAAVECQAQIVELNRALAAEGGPDVRLSVRIGVTTGEAMVGNCGSTQRMDYTAIGDCVNLASRLEQANKFFGTGILVDEDAWRAADLADVPARPLGKVLVAGRAEPVNVWEIPAGAEAAMPELSKALGEFAQAVELLAGRDFAAAAGMFERVQTLLPDDKPAQIYLEVCRQYLAHPPDENWPGHVFDVSH